MILWPWKQDYWLRHWIKPKIAISLTHLAQKNLQNLRKIFSRIMSQNNTENVYFLNYEIKKKMAILCFGQCQSQWSYFPGHKIIYILHRPYFGHPVYQFLQKPEFSDFTVSWFRLPWVHRLWKYVSLCLPNSYVMAIAQRSRALNA